MTKQSNQRFVARLSAAVRLMAGVPVSISDAQGMAALIGVGDAAGVPVNHRTMLQLSAVWSCVRLISETIATLPLSVYERTSNGRRVAPQHPLHWIIHEQPNADSTASVFWESVVAAMLLRGKARAEMLMVGGRLVGLEFLYPPRLHEGRTANGGREWRYTDENGRRRVIPDSRIWKVPGFSLDGQDGVSVVQYGASVFGNALAADAAANNAFRTGRIQTLYYKIANFLTPKQRADFKANLAESVRKGEVPLLEGGTEIGNVGMNAEEVQLLESRGFSVEEICRWFRVPPWMVGHTEKSSSWGTGIEQQMIGFLTFTLGPWLKRIEQSIRKDLMSPADRVRYYARYSVEGLLRADSTARGAFYAVMVNNGILTRDEVRVLEDREPMGGNAAVLTVQSAMTTLDGLGQSTDSQQTRAALRAFLGFDDEPQKG